MAHSTFVARCARSATRVAISSFIAPLPISFLYASKIRTFPTHVCELRHEIGRPLARVPVERPNVLGHRFSRPHDDRRSFLIVSKAQTNRSRCRDVRRTKRQPVSHVG